MRTFAEGLLAFFAAAGLFSLIWLFLGRLLSPAPTDKPFFALIPVLGDAAELEQTVQHLLWLQGGNLARFRIVLLDMGLSVEGKRLVSMLLTREPGLMLTDRALLPTLLEKDG